MENERLWCTFESVQYLHRFDCMPMKIAFGNGACSLHFLCFRTDCAVNAQSCTEQLRTFSFFAPDRIKKGGESENSPDDTPLPKKEVSK